jgi:hypothetical protein
MSCPHLRQPRFLKRNARDKRSHEKFIRFLGQRKRREQLGRFAEIARVLVRFDHVARFIVNANHSTAAIDSNGRTIWIADAHRGEKCFVVSRDAKLTARIREEFGTDALDAEGNVAATMETIVNTTSLVSVTEAVSWKRIRAFAVVVAGPRTFHRYHPVSSA